MILFLPYKVLLHKNSAYVLPDCIGVNDIIVLHTERIKPHGIRT